jgi:hypothetical protein
MPARVLDLLADSNIAAAILERVARRSSPRCTARPRQRRI